MARTQPLVTATEYGVSTTSGTGITGVLLNVYRLVPRQPTPDDPVTCEVDYAVKNMPFHDGDAADAYCLEHGWLEVYRPRYTAYNQRGEAVQVSVPEAD
jgi:hypothetical protein